MLQTKYPERQSAMPLTGRLPAPSAEWLAEHPVTTDTPASEMPQPQHSNMLPGHNCKNKAESESYISHRKDALHEYSPHCPQQNKDVRNLPVHPLSVCEPAP